MGLLLVACPPFPLLRVLGAYRGLHWGLVVVVWGAGQRHGGSERGDEEGSGGGPRQGGKKRREGEKGGGGTGPGREGEEGWRWRREGQQHTRASVQCVALDASRQPCTCRSAPPRIHGPRRASAAQWAAQRHSQMPAACASWWRATLSPRNLPTSFSTTGIWLLRPARSLCLPAVLDDDGRLLCDGRLDRQWVCFLSVFFFGQGGRRVPAGTSSQLLPRSTRGPSVTGGQGDGGGKGTGKGVLLAPRAHRVTCWSFLGSLVTRCSLSAHTRRRRCRWQAPYRHLIRCR